MGLFKRVSSIIKSQVNAFAEKKEDPAKMLEQTLTDMGIQLQKVKAQVGEAMAAEKMLKQKVDEEDRLAEDWYAKAQNAMEQGREDLAREALAQKRSHKEAADLYDKQLTEQHNAVEQLKLGLEAMNAKLEDAKHRKTMLIARAGAAQTTTNVQRAIGALGDGTSAFEAMDKMERKILDFEAEVDAGRELNDVLGDCDLERKFDDLNNTLDADLAALRLRANGENPAVEKVVKADRRPEKAPVEDGGRTLEL